MKFDLYTQTEDTKKAESSNLPLDDSSIKSMIFDPPFLVGYYKKDETGKIGKRFGGFKNIRELWNWYEACLKEFHRILKHKGILIFKCQDTVSQNRNWFSHCQIMSLAIQNSFTARDLFILNAKSRPIGHNHKNQKHARKFHSYFWVFENKK